MKVPFVDLGALHARLKPELMQAMEAVLDARAFIKGPYLARFEQDFAASLGVAHAVGCSNGTSALALILEALGIGPGDEVIVPAHTFIATAEAVCHVGATPVFADIEPGSYTLDPEAAAQAVTPRTRAIIPVHLYGTPARMDALSALAERHGLHLVEDCAQAHLAAFQGRSVGGLGAAGSFSFFPGKNLGALGDAGAVTTGDAVLAEAVRCLADHGRLSKYEHSRVGYNHRMDGLQAAVLSVKLPHLAEATRRRQKAAAHYDQALKPRGFKVIEPPPGATACVYHLYVAEVADRDRVQAELAAAGIETGVHYPLPLHLQPAFAHLGGRKGQFPVTERAAVQVLSLPICGEITADKLAYVCERLLAVARPAS